MSEASSRSGAAVVTSDFRRGALIVRCTGEVDMTSAVELREAIDKALTDRPSVLVIDLVGVDFFSSAGIAALVAAQEQSDRAGVLLAVVATGRPVLRPLEVTTVDLILTLYTSVDGALGALNADRAVVEESPEV